MIDDNFYQPLPLNPGDVYSDLPFGDEVHTIEVVQGCEDVGDGVNVLVSVDGGEQRLMPMQMIQEAADYARKSGIEIQIKTGQDTLQKEKIGPLNEKSEVTTSKNYQNNIKTPSRKEEIIENLGNIGCLVILLLAFCWLFFTCNKQKKEQRAQEQRQEFVADSIAQRRKYEKDSIDSVKNTPEYKARMDSIHLVWEKEREDEEKSTVVMVCAGDTIYHFMTQCFNASDIGKIRLMSEYKAKRSGLKECVECISDFSRDEYIYFEDVIDYVRKGWSKSELVDMFDITSDDLW